MFTFNEYLKQKDKNKDLILTKEQVKEMQKQLGVFCQYYFLTEEESKCCDCYPKFETTNGFDCKCWFECLVCGKRTKLCDTNAEALKEWRKKNVKSKC